MTYYSMPSTFPGRLALAGVVFFVAGILLGFAPSLSADEGTCGAAFTGTSGGGGEGCSAKRAEVRGYAVNLMIVGGVGVAMALVLASPNPATDDEDE